MNNNGKRKGNGVVFVAMAIPVVFCLAIVIAAVIYLNDSKKEEGEKMPHSQIEAVQTEDDKLVTNTESSTSVKAPENKPSENVSAEPSIDDTTPTQPDDATLPEVRPNAPTVPEVPNEGAQVKVNTSDWNLILVNPVNYLPEGFTVELAKYSDTQSVDARIIDDLKSMISAMKADGLSPVICSSYRTHEKQQTLFNNQINREKNAGLSDEEAKVEAAKAVAIPGTSEHETGLAVDIVALSYQILDEKQEETSEQKWLMEHCYDYGFILRYPNNKSDVTGIIYEPWHYRYVGKEVAADIKSRGICFEEWLALSTSR